MPKPSNFRRSNLVILVTLVLSSILYFPLNRHTHHGYILTTSLDKHIPFLPIFAIPYLLFLPLFWLTVIYALLKKRLFVQLALAAIVVYICSDLLYVLFQTFAPRPQLVGSSLAIQLMRFIYVHDRPFNDLPSGHTAAATLFGLYFLAIKHRWRVPLIALALVVIASTLFIKQHSIIGASGGVLLALISWFSVSHVLDK
ncbi:MAG TPA: phosphatase PAP2 family protein [Verrucomicrobiae bacterium]|jgi:membrane-associated phospholipid phosphatase|nr:phosphatase PAP2 family protein [Verrucomicrobiae bacterium]